MDLKLLSRPDWDQESYPDSSDFLVLIFFAPFFLFLRLILDRCIFEVTHYLLFVFYLLISILLWLGKQVSISWETYLGGSQRVARRLVVPKGLCADSNERRKKVVKFKESAWKCLCSFSVEAFALYVTYKEPWFKDTRSFWLGPGDQVWPDQKIK